MDNAFDISSIYEYFYMEKNYWEFFWRTTFIPTLSEIFIVNIIALLTIGLAIIDSLEKKKLILTELVGKILVITYIYYLILLKFCYIEAFLFSNGLVHNTSFVLFIKTLMYIALIICIVSSLGYVTKEKIVNYEYYLLLALAAVGMIVVISANDLMVLYVGIEIQSLVLYILASIKMFSNFSTEAGLKYFIIGAFSSGLLLLGCSFIYGAIGTTHFTYIMMILNNTQDVENYKSLIFGLILVIVSLLFKIGAAPFHMWLPDVYEGAPTIVTMIYSIVPKIAIIGIIIRLNLSIFETNGFFINNIWIPAAILSIIIGTLGGLFQIKLKRLIAYSAISHVGFMVIGLTMNNSLSLFAIFFYLITYVIISINIFTFLLVVRKVDNNLKIKKINELVLIFKSNPFLGWHFCFVLFSIAGIPPLLGFYSKLYIFISALKYGYYSVAIIAAIFSVIACAYYIRLIRLLYFKEVPHWTLYGEITKLEATILTGSLFINIFFFVQPEIFVTPLYNLILNLTY